MNGFLRLLISYITHPAVLPQITQLSMLQQLDNRRLPPILHKWIMPDTLKLIELRGCEAQRAKRLRTVILAMREFICY